MSRTTTSRGRLARTPCPACGHALPFWPHAALPRNVGLPCRSCGATLICEDRRLPHYGLLAFSAVIPGAYALAHWHQPMLSLPSGLLCVAIAWLGLRLGMALPLKRQTP